MLDLRHAATSTGTLGSSWAPEEAIALVEALRAQTRAPVTLSGRSGQTRGRAAGQGAGGSAVRGARGMAGRAKRLLGGSARRTEHKMKHHTHP